MCEFLSIGVFAQWFQDILNKEKDNIQKKNFRFIFIISLLTSLLLVVPTIVILLCILFYVVTLFNISSAVGNDIFLERLLVIGVGIIVICGIIIGIIFLSHKIAKHFSLKDDAFKVIHSNVIDVGYEFYTLVERYTMRNRYYVDYVEKTRYFFRVQGLNEKIYFYNKQMYLDYKDYRGESYFFVNKERLC